MISLRFYFLTVTWAQRLQLTLFYIYHTVIQSIITYINRSKRHFIDFAAAFYFLTLIDFLR